MVNFTILAGGFSTFIATYVFDTDTSSLTLTKQTTTGENPSWIASHPQNSSILYAVNEVSPVGNLQSFIVDAVGGLKLVDTVSTGGSGPTFTNPLSTGEVSAMNFGSASCSLVATLPNDPLHFEKDSPVVDFPVNGGPSNPHMSLEHNGEVFVSDLGADKIWRLVNDGKPGKFRIQGQIHVAPGNGPRHMAIRNGILFTINEKTSTLTAQQIPAAPNGTTFPLLANVSIVPQDAPANASFAGAEILISEASDKFPDPLIYVSNRNLGPEFDPRGDSIAIFEFKNSTLVAGGNSTAASSVRRMHARQWQDGGSLTLKAQVFTGLRQIRSMALGHVADGGDEFLIAGANVDGGVAVFQRINGGRNLTEVARNAEIANRTSFVFV
ncbi:Lactonase, 7-bladed beta-propeller-domain-containing protein [Flammula alnicola]|nr:Lactonase, 7-bladed beta-propeller-domain-containing protein [Flammula alnicola]